MIIKKSTLEYMKKISSYHRDSAMRSDNGASYVCGVHFPLVAPTMIRPWATFPIQGDLVPMQENC